MVSLKSLFFYLATTSITVSAAPLTESDRTIVTPDTLISDINSITLGVKALTATLNNYNGNILDATPIAVDIAAIHVVNRKGFLDANLATPANSDDSNRIVDFTFASVGVDIPASVQVLKEKREYFSEGDLTTIVLAGLKLLKYDHDTFSAALVAKIAEDVVPRADVVVKVIDDALQSGIDYFSS